MIKQEKLKYAVSVALLALATEAAAQGRYVFIVAPFLLSQPSVRANGMGGASVVSQLPDAISVAFNPAHLGTRTGNSLSFEIYPTATDLRPKSSTLEYDAETIQFCYDLKRLGAIIPLSFGASYSRIGLEDEFIAGEGGSSRIVEFSESADVWSIGVGADYIVKAAVGWSFKDIDSNFGFNASAHDWGMLLHVPIDEAITKLLLRPYEARLHWRPILFAGLGYSKSNIGDRIVDPDSRTTSSLPRIARAGMNLSAGFAYYGDNWTLRLFKVERINEAEESLVRGSDYAVFLGDIDFWDNVILGNSNEEITSKHGWELEVLESVAIRRGRHEGRSSDEFYDTDGFGLKLSGVLKLLGRTSSELRRNPAYGFISRHIEIEYGYSKWEASEDFYFHDKTSFKSIRFGLVQR